MRKTPVILILTLLAGIALGFTLSSLLPTGQAISEPSMERSYTTAICNDNNECIDILVKCNNNQLLSLEPTSQLFQFNKDWQDSRTQENFCN